MKINKTNVARLLDKAKVAYQLVPYEVDENDLSATHVADQLGENVAQVFKTLVLHGDKSGYFVCVIPGADEVDLKKAAKVSGNKSCEMIPVKELLPLTGYIRGGCSPIGMKGMLRAAEAMTLAAIRTMEQPELIEKAQEELKRKNGGSYHCPLPDYITPPIGRY